MKGYTVPTTWRHYATESYLLSKLSVIFEISSAIA